MVASSTLNLQKALVHIKEINRNQLKINCSIFLKFTNAKQKKTDFHENFEKSL